MKVSSHLPSVFFIQAETVETFSVQRNDLHQLLLLLILGRLPALLGPLVVIVCGGSTINMEQLTYLKHKLQS